MLDGQQTEPHSYPIPNSTPELPAQDVGTALSECEQDTVVVIEQASDRDPEVLQHPSDGGIESGTELLSREVAPFGVYMLEPIDGNDAILLPEHVPKTVRVAKVELA